MKNKEKDAEKLTASEYIKKHGYKMIDNDIPPFKEPKKKPPKKKTN